MFFDDFATRKYALIARIFCRLRFSLLTYSLLQYFNLTFSRILRCHKELRQTDSLRCSFLGLLGHHFQFNLWFIHSYSSRNRVSCQIPLSYLSSHRILLLLHSDSMRREDVDQDHCNEFPRFGLC